jgi:signal transduction histidine kinase
MANNNLDKLATLIDHDREKLLSRWRTEVRQFPCASALETPVLNDHIPDLLEELVAALRSRSDETISDAICGDSPPAHGLQRLREAFDIEEVVAEYNILRGCIHDLADENGLNLQGLAFRILNRVLDQAIGSALEAYSTQRALDVRQRREEYLAFVAHDLRTPLNAISLAGYTLEALSSEKTNGTEATQMWKALRRNLENLGNLVNKVLEENSDLQTEVGPKLERREFDLWPVVEALIHDLRPVAGIGSTRLINDVPDDLVAYADAGLLRRIFQNLIANAIRYTPRGEITIGARAVDPAGGVECCVSDNGAGISADLLEKIFNKGESDPENTDGAGLGLAAVKTFTEIHGGTVHVESREGVGSTFRFSLPDKTRASTLADR